LQPDAPPWRERDIALSSPEGAKEETAMPSRKILFTNTSAEIVEDAREMSPVGFELIVAAPDSAEYVEALSDAEYVLSNVQGMDHAFCRTAQKLRLVQLFSAGCDHVNLGAARRAGVPVAKEN
jgi:phosphoglycerate dehydrogenase-like enzyme